MPTERMLKKKNIEDLIKEVESVVDDNIKKGIDIKKNKYGGEDFRNDFAQRIINMVYERGEISERQANRLAEGIIEYRTIERTEEDLPKDFMTRYHNIVDALIGNNENQGQSVIIKDLGNHLKARVYKNASKNKINKIEKQRDLIKEGNIYLTMPAFERIIVYMDHLLKWKKGEHKKYESKIETIKKDIEKMIKEYNKIYDKHYEKFQEKYMQLIPAK